MNHHAGVRALAEVSVFAHHAFLRNDGVNAGVDQSTNERFKVLQAGCGVIGCAVVNGLLVKRY